MVAAAALSAFSPDSSEDGAASGRRAEVKDDWFLMGLGLPAETDWGLWHPVSSWSPRASEEYFNLENIFKYTDNPDVPEPIHLECQT